MKVRLQQFLAIMGQARQHCSTSWPGLQHHLQERPLCLGMTLGEKTCLLSKLMLRPECGGLKCRCSKWQLKILLNYIVPTPATTLISVAASLYFCWCILLLCHFLYVFYWCLCYGLDDPGFKSRQGKEIFSSPNCHIPALGPTQYHVQMILIFFFPGIEVAGVWSLPLAPI